MGLRWDSLTNMYTLHTVCRACGSKSLTPVVNLGLQPLANDFRREDEEHAGYAPLSVLFCYRCTLAQLSVVVRPDILYSQYPYVTSKSHMMQDHFDALTRDILTEIKPGSVVEIGSNDGFYLEFLRRCGFGNVVGIDPAANLAQRAQDTGILTINDFFGPDSAKSAREAAGSVDLIVARHVFCHVDDWKGFVKSLDLLASKDTLICIEVPRTRNQIASVSFDQIYHEHLSYLTLTALGWLLSESPFHIHRVCEYDIHGGALLIMIRRNDYRAIPHPSVEKFFFSDSITLEMWKEFASEAEFQILELGNLVHRLVEQGKSVCGLGASAKGTVWINACRFTHREIGEVFDCTMEKARRFIPGTQIPVTPEAGDCLDGYDYAVLFAWNFAQEVMANHRNWMEVGGQFILPVPKPQVISLDNAALQA